MRIIKILLLLIPFTSIFANDAFVTIAGGRVQLSDQNSQIEIQSELLEIEIFENHYSVSVKYKFINHGQTAKFNTGFPEYKTSEGLGMEHSLQNFHISYGNGQPINFNYNEAEHRIDDYFVITGWYTKEIVFQGYDLTEIEITYDSVFSQFGYYDSVQYLLGTGQTWSGPINSLQINIINQSQKWWIDRVRIGNSVDYSYSVISDGVFSLKIDSYEPELKDEILITFLQVPKYYQPPRNVTQRRFIFRDRQLDDEWFRFMRADQLRILRNSIYAFHGYSFRSADLKEHFDKENWYEPDPNFNEGLLSANERTYINFMYTLEQQLAELE